MSLIGYFSERAPSAILYDKSGNPEAFGFEACEKYMSLSKEDMEQVQFAYDVSVRIYLEL